MNPSFTIRRAQAADAAEIFRLIQALALYEREPDAVEVRVEDLAQQLCSSPPPFECLLAEHEGRVVGMALYYETYSTWRGRIGIHLEDLFVEAEHRGAGIGAALLAALARETVQRGGARLEWSVLDWNETAIGFYRNLGAAPLAGWTTWRLDGAALTALSASAIRP